MPKHEAVRLEGALHVKAILWQCVKNSSLCDQYARVTSANCLQ